MFVEGNVSKKLLDNVTIIDSDLGLNISHAQVCIFTFLMDLVVLPVIVNYLICEQFTSMIVTQ